MPSQLFLAATAAEFQAMEEIPEKIGWMACHFSSYGTGLSNMPPALPPGSMVIVNDRTPVCRHDPQRIAQELAALVQTHQCSRVLLDFQRPGEAVTEQIVLAAMTVLDCPTAVTPLYAADPAWPILLPPVPLHKTVQEHLSPWQGRRFWQEIALDAVSYRITRQGCTAAAAAASDCPHRDEALHCSYQARLEPDAVCFLLQRTPEDLAALMQEAASAECFVGLYQELAQAMAHSTARFH